MLSKYKLYRIVGVLIAIGFWALAAGPTYAHGLPSHPIAYTSSRQVRPLDVTRGGGCDNSSDGIIQVCITVDGNFNIIGDGYINQVFGGSCLMTVTVIDDSTGFSASSTGHCAFLTGFVIREQYGATHGHHYHSEAFLNETGSFASSANHEQFVS